MYGHAKQGASFGHTKIAGKTVLRRGLSPLAVTICTDRGAGAGRGAATGRTRRLGQRRGEHGHRGDQHRHGRRRAAANILVRGDSAYCAGKVIAAVVKAGARFSFAIARNPAVDAAIAAIADEHTSRCSTPAPSSTPTPAN